MRRTEICCSSVLLGLVSVWHCPVNAEVILDFEAFGHSGSSVEFIEGVIVEDNFEIDPNGSGMGVFGSGADRYSGSAALYHQQTNGVTSLRHEAGESFQLKSIDLTEFLDQQSVSVNFIGQVEGGGVVTTTFTTDGDSFNPQTFSFPSVFQNLTEVSWVQAFPFHQFDNIVVAIPEPSSLALIGMGALVVIGRHNRLPKQLQLTSDARD